jgi:Ca2+-binding RTX toxin-like protein
VDTVTFASWPYQVSADLSTGTATLQNCLPMTCGTTYAFLYNLENLTGGNYDDSLTGDAGDNVIDGLDGNDTCTGGGGNDTFANCEATS